MRTGCEQLDLRGKRVTVMGLGSFGGGGAAARFVLDRGAQVVVTDLRTEDELAESIEELDARHTGALELHLGGHREPDFVDTDLVVVNPAIPRGNRFVSLACDAGVPLTSEMNLFWQHNRGRVIGVTGSNGKSTTAALIHAILSASGRSCWLGGNIGHSLLPVADQIQEDDWVVLELSSFQLQDLDRLHAAPDIAVVTNFRPNHLDWHGSLDEYRRAKQTILRWQTAAQTAVLNHDDPDVVSWPVQGRLCEFGATDTGTPGIWQCDEQTMVRIDGREQTIPLRDWLTLPGRHNLQNALAATCAAVTAGAYPDQVRQGLQQFPGLPHRLQFVAEVLGRKFYNDSLATTPESVEAALDAFVEPVVLLAGGYDKQIDLTHFAETLAGKTKAVALMGQTSQTLARLIDGCGADRPAAYRVVETFREAFQWAVAQSSAGDVVLLSPGCASYDWFRNFADRGQQFRALVKDYGAKIGEP